MIEYRKGNLLEQSDINVIIHNCNIFCNFGAGIAKQIAIKYPEAFEADKATKYGDQSKIGMFSRAPTKDRKWIVNAYAMKGIGREQRQTDYEALYSILEKMRDTQYGNFYFTGVKTIVFGVPNMIGCGLAGGSEEIVKAMLNHLWGKSNGKLVVVDFNS